MITLDTTRAQEFPINIWDYNRLPVIATFTSNGLPLNLTNYRFDFILKRIDLELETYTILAAELNNAFLAKMGDGVNVLYLRGMLEDIRTRIVQGNVYRLLMKVTNPAGEPYIYMIHPIYGRQH